MNSSSLQRPKTLQDSVPSFFALPPTVQRLALAGRRHLLLDDVAVTHKLVKQLFSFLVS